MTAYLRVERVLVAALLCCTVLIGGCSQSSAPAAAGLVSSGAVPEHDYRLSIGDKLRIVVFGETELSGDHEVGANGLVSLPLLGEVPAKGRTLPELTRDVRERLERGYIKSPKVSIQILNFRPFYVHGEVRSGGEFAYRSSLRIVDAVALAGGYTYRADTSYIYLRREGDAAERAVLNDGTLVVLPGDNIRIPERFF